MIDSYQQRDIEILKRALIDCIYQEELRDKFFAKELSQADKDIILSEGVRDPSVGDGWINPSRAETMVGLPRLSNFQSCIQDTIDSGIEGDIIETGVWRGGACILASAIVKYNKSDKKVYVADSFEGLPKPEDKYEADKGDPHHTLEHLKVSLEQVQDNFKKYGLLTENVSFIKGFFKDSLKKVPFKKLAGLRLDGDMYSSTWEVLTLLYDKLSVGGYLIVDDYYLPACKKAVDDFRESNNITEDIVRVDWTGIYWKKNK